MVVVVVVGFLQYVVVWEEICLMPDTEPLTQVGNLLEGFH